MFYGPETFTNTDDITDIYGSSTGRQSVYEFDGTYPVFLLASFTADSLSNDFETGFSLTFLLTN